MRGFQSGTGRLRLRIGTENQLTHATSIHFAARVKYSVAELLANLLLDSFVFQCQVAGSVSFDNRDVVLIS
jgi:hypothetical protein